MDAHQPEPPGAAQEQAVGRAGDEAGEEQGGGDAVCWLDRVCPDCGALDDGPAPPVCARCGAPRP